MKRFISAARISEEDNIRNAFQEVLEEPKLTRYSYDYFVDQVADIADVSFEVANKYCRRWVKDEGLSFNEAGNVSDVSKYFKKLKSAILSDKKCSMYDPRIFFDASEGWIEVKFSFRGVTSVNLFDESDLTMSNVRQDVKTILNSMEDDIDSKW